MPTKAFKVEQLDQSGRLAELTKEMVELSIVGDHLDDVGAISIKEMPSWDEEAIEALEKRVKHLEDIAEQAVRELDHYADEPTDPDAIDKVSDLIEVLRKVDEFRQTSRTESEDSSSSTD